MTAFRHALGAIPFPIVVVLCLTLGLAPFTPEPHIWEKLKMLAAGELRAAIDWFDFALHSAPWLLLILKIGLGRPSQPSA